MPATDPLPNVPFVDPQAAPFHYGNDPVGDPEAILRVKQTFDEYSSKRQARHDRRWQIADNLYNGVVPIRYWDDNTTERSAIPNNIAFDHVETVQAQVESAFQDNPEMFHVEPTSDSSPEDAREVEDVISGWFDSIPDDFSTSTAACEFRQTVHQILQYGSGFGMLDYTKSGQQLKFLDLRDVYVDPQCQSPNIEHARSIVISRWMTIDEINAMRNNPKIYVPPNGVLWALSKSNPVIIGEDTKLRSELSRGIYGEQKGLEFQPSPELNQIHLKIYMDKNRFIWTLGDCVVMVNTPNPYGFYPLLHAPCRLVPGSFYGIGLPESVQWPQRYSEALRNCLVDASHLAMDAPLAVGQDVKGSNTKMRPGLRIFTENPKNSLAINTAAAVFNVMPLIGDIEALAAKRNGSPDPLSGAARPGNVRTRAGVDAQMSGGNLRVKHIVENITDFFWAQLLKKTLLMVQAHTMPSDVLMGRFADPAKGQKRILAAAFHKPMRFRMDAGTRMKRRDDAKQMIPLVGQAMLNGPTQQGIAASGKSFNWDAFTDLLADATGKRYQWTVPMSEEEKKHRAQPPPEIIAEQQKAQQDAQVRLQMGQMGIQKQQIDAGAKVQVAQIAKAPDPAAAQQKMQEFALDSYWKKMEMQMDQQSKQQDLQAKAQEHQMNLAATAAKMQQEQRSAEMKAAIEQQKMAQDQQRTTLDHQNQIRQMMLDAQRQQMMAAAPTGPAMGGEQ